MPSQPEQSRRRIGYDALWTVAAFFAVAWVYWWTATQGLNHFGSPGGNMHLLDLQVEAFQAGQLALKVKPAPALVAARDPYDPAQNRATRLLDASYYHGKYYTYFGPAPLVLWLWPWYAIVGRHAPADLTALVFGLGAFLFQTLTLAFCRRRWFPNCPAWGAGLLVLAVGLMNFVQPLVRAHSTFQIPVLSELCFASACAYFVARALADQRRGLPFWAAASLCFGLAAGSRANFLPAGIVLLAAFAWSRRRSDPPPKNPWPWAAALAPAAACLAALGVYNFLRFGNPFDFGSSYTLVEGDWRHRAAFSAHYFLTNLYYYFVSWPRLSHFFPYYLESAPLPSFHAHDYLVYVDRMAGLIPVYPFALLSVFSLREALRPPPRPGFRPFTLVLGGLGVAVTIPILFFVGSSLRYQAEFMFPLLTLAGVGVLALADRMAVRWRRSAIAVVAVLAGWTAAANFLIACTTYGNLKTIDPSGFRRIRSVCERVVYPVERALGWQPRIPRVTLKFPTAATGRVEPLWVGGTVPTADFLYVYYATPETIQFGFESMGRGGPVTGQIPIDYDRTHNLEIVAGPFLPPAGHPFYRDSGLGTGRPADRLLRIVLDGKVVMDAVVPFHDERDTDAWGHSDEDQAFGRRFTGSEFSVAWVPFRPPMIADLFDPNDYGALVLTVTWRDLNQVRLEPLVAIGGKNLGQTVLVRFEGGDRIRLGVEESNSKVVMGRTVAVDPGSAARIIVNLPALYPGADWWRKPALRPVPEFGTISVDGHELLRAALPNLRVGPRAIALGSNPMQIAGVREHFSGIIRLVGRRWAAGSAANAR